MKRSFSEHFFSVTLRQGLPTCGTRRSSRWYASNFHFFTETCIPGFLVYVSGFLYKENKSSCSLLFLLYRNIMTFDAVCSQIYARHRPLSGRQGPSLWGDGGNMSPNILWRKVM